MRSLKFENQVFDHNFSRSARIELRFWEVANLEKLNNFYLGHFESLLTKKWLFCSFGLYLARARARARSARPPRAGGPGLPHVQKRQAKHVLPRARFEIWRSFARAGRACYVVFWRQRTIYSLDWAFIIEQKLRPHKKISPYGRGCKNASFCLGQISSFSMMFARLSKSSKNLHYWAKISRLETPLMYNFRHLLP